MIMHSYSNSYNNRPGLALGATGGVPRTKPFKPTSLAGKVRLSDRSLQSGYQVTVTTHNYILHRHTVWGLCLFHTEFSLSELKGPY